MTKHRENLFAVITKSLTKILDFPTSLDVCPIEILYPSEQINAAKFIGFLQRFSKTSNV